MNKIVLGLQFGDEGKGMVTDMLVSHSLNPLVIRFSGGHQAGHTVVTDTYKHIFSNFGSGTLREAPTYWSKYCTVAPISLVNELNILKKKNINPQLYVDQQCPVTTPYDIRHNKEWEEVNSHGSCGVGFGSTIEREEKHYSLTFIDIFYPKILEAKLKNIRIYYKNNYNTIKIFLECCKIIRNSENISIVNQDNIVLTKPALSDCIFEGSQGLLLDQNFGFFPNVTRSNTGCKNVIELVGSEEYEVYLVTRAYQTRHGNGFMTNENLPHNIKANIEETNVENKWQGKFRRTLLDVDLLEYAIQKDKYISRAAKQTLIITCLDHIENEHRFTYKDKIVNCNNENDFIEKVRSILDIKNILLSHSPNSKNIVKFA